MYISFHIGLVRIEPKCAKVWSLSEKTNRGPHGKNHTIFVQEQKNQHYIIISYFRLM